MGRVRTLDLTYTCSIKRSRQRTLFTSWPLRTPLCRLILTFKSSFDAKHDFELHSNSFPDELKGMQLSDFRLKVFLCFLLVVCYLDLQMFDQFVKQENTILSASKSSVKSFTTKFHFFSAFSSGPGQVTILVLAHNSVKVESINTIKVRIHWYLL